MKKSLLVCFLLASVLARSPAPACTGLVVQDGERVLVGNNEDWFNPRTKIWFIQPFKDRHGCVFFGYDNFWPQGGMNQAGLVFDAFALKAKAVEEPVAKPRFKGNLIKEMMATCATVEEALVLLDRYSLDFMTHFQLFIVDASGDAAIVEAEAVVRKKGSHQVVTNFRQSETDPDRTSCWRYLTASKLLAQCQEDRRDCLRGILKATHQEGDFPTLYSNIYDLTARRVHLYYFHDFETEVLIDLEKELERKPGVIDLPTLFPTNMAAQSFRARFTSLKKKYVHDVPRFTVRYPSVYEDDEPLDASQVLLAKCRYGQAPVLTVSVAPAEAHMTLSRVGGEVYAPGLRQLGKQVTMLSNRPTKLTDGSAAYETRFAWRWEGHTKINSLVLFTLRENHLISVGLHHTGELDYLLHIPYSLRFE